MSTQEPFGKERAASIKSDTERKLKEAFLNITLDGFKWLEVLSSWLLLIAGAALPILLSHTADVLILTSTDRFRLSIHVLLLSAMCGIWARMRCSQVTFAREMYHLVMERVKQISDEEDAAEEQLARDAAAAGREPATASVDLPAIVEEVQGLTPWYARRVWAREGARGQADVTYPLKKAVRFNGLTSWAVLLQVFAFIMAILVLVWPT